MNLHLKGIVMVESTLLVDLLLFSDAHSATEMDRSCRLCMEWKDD